MERPAPKFFGIETKNKVLEELSPCSTPHRTRPARRGPPLCGSEENKDVLDADAGDDEPDEDGAE